MAESDPLIHHGDDQFGNGTDKKYSHSINDTMSTAEMMEAAPKKVYPLWYRTLLMIILICSGASMTLCMKTQDQQCLADCADGSGTCLVDCNTYGNGTNGTHDALTMNYNAPWMNGYAEGLAAAGGDGNSTLRHFHQPFIQLFHLGFGQLVSGAFTPLYDAPEEHLSHLMPIPFLKFFPQAALASVFDVCAEVLIILGLALTRASVTEMLKTTLVVFVGLLSLYFFPGFSVSWKQWVASGVMLCGALVVILQEYITGDTDADTLSEIGGACLVVGAQLFYGMEFVVEEKLIDHSKFDGYHVNKAKLVFALGVLSMSFAVLLQLPYTAISSDFATFYEELQVYFTTPIFWASGIGISLGVMGFDLAGLGISEVMGSDRRAIAVAGFQVAIVWTVSILVGWEYFSFVSLAGFLLILASGAAYVYFSKTKEGAHGKREDVKHDKPLVSTV